MAKYVVVQFDNNDEADSFVQTISSGFDHLSSNANANIQIVAVFQKPTLFCECATPSENSVRGSKWGWWLCRNPGCGKPKRGQFQQPRNLLDPANIRTDQKRLFVNIKEPLQP